jgi:alkylation response protein AidB-like acyl-CoA dehydrogenase
MLAVTLPKTARYLEALERLAPLVNEHRPSFDRDRKIPDAVFRPLAEAGLFRLWLPAGLGGAELSPLEFMRVVEAASALDGSIGWIVANGGGMSRAGGYLPERVARDFFADPYAFIVAATGAVGSAQAVDGGYRVTGRWPFGSGAAHASRFMGLVTVKDSKNPAPLCCYFSPEDVTIHDTWHVSGLRGTGSNDFEVNDLFVPADHTHDLVAPKPMQPGLVYRMPGLSIFPWSITGAPLGIASSALGAFTEMAAQSRTRFGITSALRDREMIQSMVGRAEATLGAARAFLAQTLMDLVSDLDAGEDQLLRSRARLRTACAYAAEGSAGIVQMLAKETGASAIFESSRLERAVRDMDAAVKHIAMSPYSYTIAGRLQLGLELGAMRV